MINLWIGWNDNGGASSKFNVFVAGSCLTVAFTMTMADMVDKREAEEVEKTHIVEIESFESFNKF